MKIVIAFNRSYNIYGLKELYLKWLKVLSLNIISNKMSKTKQMYTCETCNYETNRKLNYNRHMVSKKHKKNIGELSRLHKCELCDYTSKRPFNVKIHMKTHDEGRRYKYHCETCNYKAEDIQHIRNHIKRESHKKKIISEFGDKIFVHKDIDGTPMNTGRIDMKKLNMYIKPINEPYQEPENKKQKITPVKETIKKTTIDKNDFEEYFNLSINEMKQLIKQFNNFVKSHNKDLDNYYDVDWYKTHNEDKDIEELYIEIYGLVQDDNEMNEILK